MPRGKLPRGMGGIFKRGGVWWIRYHHRGKQVRESSFSDNDKVAEKLLKKRHGEIGIGRFVGPDAERVTFEKLAGVIEDDYVTNKRATLNRAKTCLGHLREFFGQDWALSITGDRIMSYAAHRISEGAARATTRMELSILKRAFKLAVIRGFLPSMPVSVFPTIVVKNTRKGFFEKEQFLSVYRHLDEDMQPLAKFLYLLGWRRGEALGLEWRHVDLRAGVFRIEDSKNDDPRTIPYYALPELAEIIESQRKRATAVQRETGVIVTHVFFWSKTFGGREAGQPIKIFFKQWRAACRAAAIVRTPHDFRRTAARDLSRSGLSESVIMQLCGWRTASVFKRYRIVNEQDLATGLAKRAGLDAELESRAARARERAQGMRRSTEEAQSPRKAERGGGEFGRK